MAQFEAWNRYIQQALQKRDAYLLRLATVKLALFGGRLILTHNELLFPYHNWLSKVLNSAEARPANLDIILMVDLMSAPLGESAFAFYSAIKEFTDWDAPEAPWSMQFMLDSELNWVSGETPVDDL